MPKKEYKPSQYISDFLNFLKDSQSLYNYAVDMEDKEEKLTQDYLHKLELEADDYKTKCKIVTKLAANRKARRRYKDIVQELEPIVSWTNSDYGQKAVNMLKQGLGQVRKQESYHTDRTYYPRILKQWEFYEKGQ